MSKIRKEVVYNVTGYAVYTTLSNGELLLISKYKRKKEDTDEGVFKTARLIASHYKSPIKRKAYRLISVGFIY